MGPVEKIGLVLKKNLNKIFFAQTQEELRWKHSLNTYHGETPLLDTSYILCHLIFTALLNWLYFYIWRSRTWELDT